MRKSHLIVYILFLTICPKLLFASNFNFRHYRAEDGLTSNTVRSIIQDKYGFIWIGTEDGLNRFDGRTFKEYRGSQSGTNLIGSNYACTLMEDSRGDIWIGTDDGIYVYHPLTDSFSRFMAKANGVMVSSTVNNIVEDKSGNIWVSTYGQGIFSYNLTSKKIRQYRTIVVGNKKENCDLINFVYVDSSNRIWIAPKTSIYPLACFDPNQSVFLDIPIKQTNAKREFSIYRIFEDSYHNFWLGTWETGLFKFNIQDRSIVSYLSPFVAGGITHIHEINEYIPGYLLVGSDDGMSLFNTTSFTHQLFTSNEIDPSALSDKFVYPILKDREGGLWVGTYFGGVNYLSPNSGLFERYTHSRYKNSVSGNIISRFTEDKKGNIWIASDDGSLNCLNPITNQFSAFKPQAGKNSISYHNVHALCWDNDDLWIGTYTGGLNVLNTKTGKFKHYNTSDNLRTLDGSSIYAIYKDKSSRIWVTSMSGVNLYNRQTDDFTRFKHLNAQTLDIKQDSKGWIWFATQGKGLFRYDPAKNTWRNYLAQNTKGSLLCNQLNCLLVDKKERLWVGTSNGLCRYDYATDQFIPIDLNIPSNTICSIIEDNDILWITTSKGLLRYNTHDSSVLVFTQSDGLVSNQFIANSGFKSSNGRIYIGSASGFNAFSPQSQILNKIIPKLAITSLEIFNKEVKVEPDGILPQSIELMKQIDLSYKDNVFSIGFVALSYITPEKNRYAYKLEGFDKDWNYVNKQNKATYTNLPAGDYVFRVKATNNDGVWNEEGTSIKIVIHPPFWLSPFFKFLYFILFIGAIIALIRYTNLRVERQHDEEIKALNQEKEKELYNAKIQFFTMIAHEIRTPVSLIIGPLEKIMNSLLAIPEAIRNDLNIIDRNSQRLLHLVNQLLDFRKVEQGALMMNFTSQNIYQLLRNVYDRFKPLVEQNQIEFIFDCPDTEFHAVVDQEALTKVVSNLLTNALKFTNNQIVLACRPDVDQDCFQISVQDNGKGISDEEKQKIFMPFYQIPSGNKPGTGIGLSLVKSLVDAHQGEVTITDTHSAGATFTVTIPLKNNIIFGSEPESIEPKPELQTEPEPKPTILSVAESSINKPLLLIVEDNADMRDFLCANFEEQYEVIAAADGVEGLEMVEKHEFSLIISDLMMPRMDGLEMCKLIRANVLWSHIPIVLLTAKTDLNTKIDGLNIGADAYVEKPFSINHLQAQIQNLIESRRLLRKRYSEMPFVTINSIAGNSADDLFLTKVKEIIEQNIANEDFSIDLLAEELCISRSGLFAKIKTMAEITPNELIQLIRLKKAAEYLISKEHRINEIAYMVGFNNPSYFSKCFQKQFGVRPIDFNESYCSKSE